ncbi:MAG: prepilin-type N-terminal cleavage/methylation domain-containing protein [Phycisphaerae bacterium]
MIRRGFTIIELLVVISIIALLIALLLPALAMARQQGLSVACLSNLRSQGQMLFEYGTTYEDAVPWGWDFGGTNDDYGTNSWNTLLFCNNQGISATSLSDVWFGQPSTINKVQYEDFMVKFRGIFVCPGSLLPLPPVDNTIYNATTNMPPAYNTTYCANPNFFYMLCPPGGSNPVQTQTFQLSNVQNPGQKLAIGDANQNWEPGNSPRLPTFDYEQNFGFFNNLPPNYLIPAQGFNAGMGFNYDNPTANNYWGTGLRYRHGATNPAAGWANAVFFDGHAATIPINQNVPGAAATAPGATGTVGLRVMNLTNPILPASIYQY